MDLPEMHTRKKPHARFTSSLQSSDLCKEFDYQRRRKEIYIYHPLAINYLLINIKLTRFVIIYMSNFYYYRAHFFREHY